MDTPGNTTAPELPHQDGNTDPDGIYTPADSQGTYVRCLLPDGSSYDGWVWYPLTTSAPELPYQYQTSAPAGADLLDNRYPGWRTRVNRDLFHISNFYRCVLAQIYGEYVHGLKELGIYENREAFAYGFSLPVSPSSSEWGLLQEEWVRLIWGEPGE
jgi:hypothetical protein